MAGGTAADPKALIGLIVIIAFVAVVALAARGLGTFAAIVTDVLQAAAKLTSVLLTAVVVIAVAVVMVIHG